MPDIEHREFLELLPFYVNGTLDAGERARVDSYLAAHPAARGEVAFQRALRDEVREAVPQPDPRVGLDRILREMKAGEPATGAGLFRRLTNWLDSLSPARMAPAFAAACMIVVVQAAVLTGLLLRPDESYDTLRGGGIAGAEQALIQVLFRPDTPESQLSALVRQVGARMVDGPGDLGFYKLAVPVDRAEKALGELRASQWVQDAQSVAAPAQN